MRWLRQLAVTRAPRLVLKRPAATISRDIGSLRMVYILVWRKR
jgi:hypothetical protein